MSTPKPPSREDLQVIARLAQEHRILVLVVPPTLSEKFCGSLTTWNNYCLDTGLLPPLPMPIAIKGDGVHCPFCGTGIKSGRPVDPESHALDCQWRQAIERWGMSQAKVEEMEG